MTEAKILTHPAFNRTPISNRRGPGRLPKCVVNLAVRRRMSAANLARSEEARLRAWAYANGLNAYADVALLRARKQERDAIHRLLRSNDKEAWSEIERLKSAAFDLYNAVHDARTELLQRHLHNPGR